MTTIGSIAWAKATHGKLSWRSKLALLTEIVHAQIQAGLRILTLPKPIPFELERIRIPDTAIAREASELCESVSSAPLYLHCLRTYFWGCILAGQDRLTFDPELFFVMAQLHDFGLTDAYHGKDATAACFAVEGGQAAADFCAAHGWDAQRTAQVHEAITLHLNITVLPSQGVEAHLLRAGSGLDVIGLRRREIAPETKRDVVARYPRAGFAADLNAAMDRELALRRDSRTAFLYRYAQFRWRVNTNSIG